MHCAILSKLRKNTDRRLKALVPVLVVVSATSLACVTRGTYDQVMAERNELLTQKRMLQQQLQRSEASNRNLDEENVKLLEAMEDARLSNQGLNQKLAELEAARTRLSQSLEAREAELQEVAQVKETYESLVADLEAEVATGQVVIEQLREGLQVNVADEILFASGSSRLDQQGADVLGKVAARLQKLPHRIEVGGHTDNVPIKSSARFPSNWELGAARAASVVRLFESQGIGGDRMAAISFAEYQPVAPNETPEERALNRRIEIRLIPRGDATAGLDDVVQSTAPPTASPEAAPSE